MISLEKSWNTGVAVLSVTVSPDGARVGAGCGLDVQIWDLHSGKMVLGPLQGHSHIVNSVAYSPDGRTIASGSNDKTVRIWDTATGAAAIKPLEGHTSSIFSVTFSYDGRLIISGSDDKTICWWDARTGKSAWAPIDVGTPVHSVSVSPDGSKIIGGCYDGTIKTYDAVADAFFFKHSTGHKQHVTSVAFSPDGRRFASASWDKTIRIWDVSTGSSIGDPLEEHDTTVGSVVFSPDGSYIASCSYDKTIRLWHTALGQIDSVCAHTDCANAIAFAPNGNTLVSGSNDKTIKLWDMQGTRMGGDGNVRSLGTEPLLFDEITSTTTPEQIVLHLSVRGCANLTDQLDLTTCSAYPISSGGFGDIYRCKLEDNRDVAVKTIRLYVDSSEQTQKHLKHAARELYTWSKCRHPNVQPLLGLVMFRDQIGMVAAWESNGDMPRYLQRYPNTDRCRMSLQIVAGLLYLHESGVVHGDLKGANVLVAQDGSPRLSDFGNAVSQEFSLQFTQSSTTVSLSPRWAAPELFKGAKLNVPADIYALGMTILETLTGDIPFPDKPDFAVVYGVTVKRLQPIRPESIPLGSPGEDRMWSLLERCWEYEPEKRPSTAEVKKSMKEITQRGLQRR